jgi:Tol biopolymer transport system component
VTLDLWLLRTSGGKPLGFPELVKTGLGEMDKGRPTIFALRPVTRDGTYYFNRRTPPGGGMIQLLTTKFDPDTGKVVGTPSFVSRMGGESWSPSFSRDGRWLAYLWRNPGSLPSLVIQSVESGEERVVPMTPSPVQIDWALMFPDGRSVLVAAAQPNGAAILCRMDAASGAWTLLKKPVAGEGPSEISPDGRTVILYRAMTGPGSPGLNRVIAWDIEAGQERELMEGARVCQLSRDGKQLAVARPDGKDLVIDVLPTAGGPRREVYRVPGFHGAAIEWTPDGRYLILGPTAAMGSGSVVYMRVSVEGGEVQPIGISASQDGQVRFPRTFGVLRAHPNGRQLVYTARGERAASETWALENFLPKPAK